MNDDLDTRARAAAVALHESVRGVSAPTVIAPRRRPSLAIAAVVILALVAVAITLRNEGPDNTDVVTDNDGDVPRFILDELPAGLLPTGVADLPAVEATGVVQTYWIYGDPGADDPFAVADLGVVVSRGPDVEFVPPDDGREVEIGGRPAFVAESSDPLDPRSVTLELDDGAVAYLSSRTLSDEALVDAAGSMGARGDAPRALGGLTLVAVSTATPPGTVPLPLPTTVGHIAGYQTDDDALNKVIVVASVAGGEDAYLVARWALGATSHAVTIRGTEGWVGSPYGESSIVVWRESPTNLVAVSAFGLDEASALAAAESLQVAGDDVWAELLSGTGEVRVPSSAQAGVSGASNGGPSYAAYLDRDGQLCLDIETADGSSGSCGGGDTSSLVVQTAELGDGQVVVYGYTTLGTQGAVRINADGEPAGSEAYYDDGTVFAFVVPASHLPAEIVVTGSDGTELGRAAVPTPSGTGATSPTTMSG